jgi:hypothetical protein
MKSKQILMSALVGLAMLATPIIASAKDHKGEGRNYSHQSESRSFNVGNKHEYRNIAAAGTNIATTTDGTTDGAITTATRTTTRTTATAVTTAIAATTTALLTSRLTMDAAMQMAPARAAGHSTFVTSMRATATPGILQPPEICCPSCVEQSKPAAECPTAPTVDCLVASQECRPTRTTATTTTTTAATTSHTDTATATAMAMAMVAAPRC